MTPTKHSGGRDVTSSQDLGKPTEPFTPQVPPRTQRVQEIWKEYSEQRGRGFSEEMSVRQVAWALAHCELELERREKTEHRLKAALTHIAAMHPTDSGLRAGDLSRDALSYEYGPFGEQVPW